MNSNLTIVQEIARCLSEAGVQRIFGLPGGGSSLDLIEAAAEVGIDFVLAKTENAAIMMAGASAEMTGILGVALTTKGPGVANGTNGVAYASLDRAPVLVITDGFTSKQLTYVTHQVFDQASMLLPVVKGFARLESEYPAEELMTLIKLACTAPMGPVHIELTSETARKVCSSGKPLANAIVTPPADQAALAEITKQLSASRRPVVIVGLEARQHEPQVRELVSLLQCPVLPTYKGKGIVSDHNPQVVCIFTGGSQEEECLRQCDLMVLVGLDPVEMILQPWRFGKPAIDLALVAHPVHYIEPVAKVYGDLSQTLTSTIQSIQSYTTDWTSEEIQLLRRNALSRLAYPVVTTGVAPNQIVKLAAARYARSGLRPRMSVDAGAHMFSATAFFPSTHAGDTLISNGLATMAFALPAAIAASLEDPSQPVMCFTGDGGLMMCMGELCTAVENKSNIIVVVFNDSALSLIDIKQQSRNLPARGVRWNRHDFAAIMTALGGKGFPVTNESQYCEALDEALQSNMPSLIDVMIDPSGYAQQLKAMRG